MIEKGDFMAARSSVASRKRSMPAAVLAVAGAAALAWPGQGAFAQQEPVVDVTGGQIRGTTSEYDDDVYVFKGIPYGADTGGENRFRPPQPVEPWSGVRAATELGDRCPQGGFPPPPFMQEEGEDMDDSPMSEDCLRLNVWTPAVNDGGRRPVMVWFHGGGYSSGSGGSIRYDGTRLAANQDVVLVTTNHRLNVFGYLNLQDVSDEFSDVANPGLLDLVQSLEWIRDNITTFGGDPDNVTIFGQSGGGAKVTSLMAMPDAQGLFHRAIAQSGVQSGPIGPRPAASDVLETLGVSDAGALAELETDEVMEAMDMGNWGPWVDGEVLPAAPFDGSAPAVSSDVPLLLGWTQTESTFFSGPVDALSDDELLARVTEELEGDESAAEALIADYRGVYPMAANNEIYLSIVSDRMFGREALEVARMKGAQEGAPAYLYHFRGMTEVRNLMSPHTIDIAYAFDNLELSTRTNGEVTPDKQALADLTSSAWAGFAQLGAPIASDMPLWKSYTPDSPALMVLDTEPELIEGSQGLLGVLGGP